MAQRRPIATRRSSSFFSPASITTSRRSTNKPSTCGPARCFSIAATRGRAPTSTAPAATRWADGGASLAVVALAGVVGVAYWTRIDWRLLAKWPQAPVASPPPIPARELPPLPRRSETALARATVLAAGGHLRDAL